MGVIGKIADKAAGKVSKLAVLSSEEIEKVQLQREEYLLAQPKPNDEVARERTEKMMAASSVEIYNAFLPQIKDLYLPLERSAEYKGNDFDTGHNIRYFNITKWVTDKDENSIEKLVNVYAVLSGENCNIALVFDRKIDRTNVYLAVVNTDNASNNTDADEYKRRLVNAIRGNFPGSTWKGEDEDDGCGVLPCFDSFKDYSVATASNIPTEKSEKYISQTIEKLLDGIIPSNSEEEYILVLLATPILDIEERKLRLGEFYSGLVPYASWSTSFQYTENSSTGSSATVGVNAGVSAGVQNAQNHAITDSSADSTSQNRTDTDSLSSTETESESYGTSESSAHTDGTSNTVTNQSGTSDTLGGSVNTSVSSTVGASATAGGGFVPASATVSTSVTGTVGASVDQHHAVTQSVANALGKTASDTITKGFTNTLSSSLAKTTGNSVANSLGKAVTKTMAATKGATKGVNFGGNFGANFARSSTVSFMVGKNEGINQNFENYNIKHALELLEVQMKRLEQSSALGMWDFAAYVLSEDQTIANNVAHSYLSLTLGEESYMSKSATNLWRGKVEEEKPAARELYKYLRELRHPVFLLNSEAMKEDLAYNVYPSIITATTSLSGKELAYSLNFPRKSISGLPVLECAEFGRNVVTYDSKDEKSEKISIGKIFHMNQVDENNLVKLNKESLTSHTFVTGSTGSGKSNTVYQMLEKVSKHGTKFLVVEPAKGEYKSVFGGRKDVSVFGTNPKLSPLLRINPFSFPKNIHILEHMDRLVEIFNVCWPMYAAMPAVLKGAIEKSYEDSGWDMIDSTNKYSESLYPSFADVARNVKEIIDTSEYDAENKGAYKGSLLTRLQSLCNGINGLIFVADEISDNELFDCNVIVDLSRVGSSETKSLIMGMMVLKLQEHRISDSVGMNSELKHITVLEEAHNLLRRTSVEQSSEGSNLMGKSVEMLSNAIAEMRTYGEGFIIADQAPGLMDMSVIRNTNTKIIMRLPDQADRELVGRAANLNEEQITEIAKLPCGVAAVYQNEWVQPVLCKVDLFDVPDQPYTFDGDQFRRKTVKDIEGTLLDCIMEKEIFRKDNKHDLRALKSKIIKSKLDTYVKRDFLEYIDSKGKNGIEALRTLVYDFLSAENAIILSKHCNDITEWTRSVVGRLNPSLNGYSGKQIDLALALILYEQTIRDSSYGTVFCKFTEVYKNEGGVF